MFKTFTFKSLASLALIVAVAGFGAAEPALAKKKKMNIPGHWERSQDGGFEWVGKKSKKPIMGGDGPVVRDHRNGNSGGGGVVVSNTSEDPIVRDHRETPVVRDHRKKMIFGIPAAN